MALQEQPANQASSSSTTTFSTSQLVDPTTLKSQAEVEAYAKKLLEAGGDDLVRKMLKEAINQNKKMDQEVLKEKRQADAEQKAYDDLSAKQTLKIEQAKLELKQQCATLLKQNQLIEQILEKLETANPEMERLQGVRAKFVDETSSITEKTEKQRQEAAALVEETEKLREEFARRKKEFDDKVQEKIANWKQEESSSTDKITQVQIKLQEHILLQQRLAKDEELLGNLRKTIEQLNAAEQAYGEKNDEFRKLIEQSKEALDLYEKNIVIRTKNVGILEDEKKKNHDEEQQMRETLHKMKSSGLKELKRRVQNLEKEKQALEKKSRELVAANKK